MVGERQRHVSQISTHQVLNSNCALCWSGRHFDRPVAAKPPALLRISATPAVHRQRLLWNDLSLLQPRSMAEAFLLYSCR